MRIINELPDTPYLIFIRGIDEKSDQDIFDLLGLEDTALVLYPDYWGKENYISISRDQQWVHLMDNWFYTLWHSHKQSGLIEELGKELEIFTCSVGEYDRSFDFRYYKQGQKVREYVVTSPGFNEELISVNFGLPLPGEQKGLSLKTQFERIIYIARQLGIELPKAIGAIKCYTYKL